MYVKRLVLDNIRCFENCSISFSKNITLLTGANNSGKSTILKSLYKLQNSVSLTYKDLRSTTDSGHFSIELDDISNSNRKFFNPDTRFPENKSNAFIVHNFSRDKEFANLIFENESSEGLSIEKLRTKESNNAIRGAFRTFPNTEEENNFIYPYFSKRKTTYFSMQGGKESTYSVLDTLQNLPAKVQKVKSQPFINKKFVQLCEDILGLDIGIIPGDGNEHKLGIYTSFNTTIPLECMGEGVVNIIGILVTLLTEDGKLFLIEELENDIHPTVLKKILNLIIEKSHNNQFIISTHSNIVLKYLGSLEETKIIFTETSVISGENTYLPIASSKEISNSIEERQKVLELLGYDLFDYEIYSAFLILEESTAERLIREFFIPRYYPELKFKVRTIAAKGISDVSPKFNDLHRLFLYLHKSEIYKNKSWVLVDGDVSGKETVEKLQKTFNSWDSSFFMHLENENIESYYPKLFHKKVQRIDQLPNGLQKQQEKANLLNSVFEWIENDTNSAMDEFSISGKEIIDKLKSISDVLVKN